MKIGALIITTGLSRISGVSVLLSEVGSISAGQRMVAALHCAGASMVGLVVGPEEKKQERQLSRNGVVFLRCPEGAGFFRGLQEGLSFMRDTCDRIFVVPGDVPLFLPSTLKALLQRDASVVIPNHNHVNGYPLLLDHQAVDLLLSQSDSAAAEEAIRQGAVTAETVHVSDPGILLHSMDMRHRKELIRLQNRQLARPVLELSLQNGSALYDPRLSMILHLVEQTGSVRDACSLMQLSYSTAWNMLNHAENELGFPLVKRIRGGSVGSGSVLTEKGRRLMAAYDGISERLEKTARHLCDDAFAGLLQLDI